jgi:hypothetical protein
VRADIPPTPDLDLLKTEITLLASKISSVVDTLWKVRTASITLWTAVLGVGLGSFTGDKKPIVPLLILSCLLPVAFINIDARNNRWYRRLSYREYAIQQYLNDTSFVGPAPFPIYDLAGTNTFRESKRHDWEFSLLRSIVDPIPLTVYGGQLLFSAAACTIYIESPLRWCVPASVALALVGLSALANVARARASRPAANATQPHERTETANCAASAAHRHSRSAPSLHTEKSE